MLVKKLLFLLAFILIWCSNVYGEPQISSFSGTFSHGGTITIQGSNFGTKSPATPLHWDDCEDKTVNSHSAVTSVYSAAWPPAGCASTHQIKYQSSPYRNVTAAHGNSTKFLCGGHKQYPIGEARYGNKVGVSVDGGSAKRIWYASWYVAHDPLWPATNDNWKYTRYSDASGSYEAGETTHFYWNYDTASITTSESRSRGSSSFSCSDSKMINYPTNNDNSTFNSSPRSGKWIKIEDFLDNNPGGFVELRQNNDLGIRRECSGSPLGFNPRSATMGGFWRQIKSPETQNDNAWRYFDDIYIDNTFSRVILANNSTYSNATIVEPQIPSAWSAGSITVQVNQGAIPDGEAYLFVFDADNNHNSTGYPVSVTPVGDSSGGDDDPLSAPSAPTLRVVE